MVSMARIQRLATILAVLAAVAALYYLLSSDGPGTEPVVEYRADDALPKEAPSTLSDHPVQGGVYAGRVIDQDGKPIHAARVLLVAYGAGGPNMLTAGADADPQDISDIPILGSYSEGGEGITKQDGTFRIAADSQSHVTRVLAYHQGYFLNVVGVSGPRNDILLRLQRAGKVIGTVVDDETGAPVQGARVDVYLQQKVDKVPDNPEGGQYAAFKREKQEQSWLATLGRFTSKVLGPRIWDVVDSGSETLRLSTDANGHFELGPLGNSVQLEFVVTHPKYIWYDFDTRGGKQTPQRTVVEPGETVRREFRMRLGHHISGQVMDDQGKGLADVYVKVQSISAYYKHWWYRDKWRSARTDSQGRFRVEGLTRGAQQLVFQHPSFKEKTISVQKVPADDLIVVAERFGALAGKVEGIPTSKHARRLLVLFEAVDEVPQGPRQFRRTVPLDKANAFIVQRVHPGSYRVWVKLGKVSSQPVEIEIAALETLRQSFELGAGGVILARIIDDAGGLVDPASVRLVALRGDKERALGTFVSRGGDLEIEGVAPGRYRLRVQAPGCIVTTTEPFEVSEARTANLGALRIQAWGFLRFGHPENARGRPATITEEIVVEYRSGSGPWQRIINAGIDVPVRPGTLSVRARSGSMRFESTVEVQPTKTSTVKIVFDDGT